MASGRRRLIAERAHQLIRDRRHRRHGRNHLSGLHRGVARLDALLQRRCNDVAGLCLDLVELGACAIKFELFRLSLLCCSLLVGLRLFGRGVSIRVALTVDLPDPRHEFVAPWQIGHLDYEVQQVERHLWIHLREPAHDVEETLEHRLAQGRSVVLLADDEVRMRGGHVIEDLAGVGVEPVDLLVLRRTALAQDADHLRRRVELLDARELDLASELHRQAKVVEDLCGNNAALLLFGEDRLAAPGVRVAPKVLRGHARCVADVRRVTIHQ